MRNTIRKTLKRKLWIRTAFKKLILRKSSYLHTSGWIESLRRGYPCDAEGLEIPWMNYPVVNILKERLNKDLSLFEFGSGYSTLFYAKLVRDVTSVEYNKDWYDFMNEKAIDNVSLLYREKDIDGSYCRTIHEAEREYDVVVVDGRDRVNCVKQSIDKLSSKGVVLLDDSSRDRYQEGIEYAKHKGFRALDIEGLKPSGYGIDRTTLLYRNDNCLDI